MKKAFTLVEILVVIAILAIIAAILFPVLSRAKVSAKDSASLSNLRQIGQSSLLYAADSGDTLPYCPDFTTYNLAEQGLGGGSLDHILDYKTADQLLAPYGAAPQLWESPADPGDAPRSSAVVSFYDELGSSYEYGTGPEICLMPLGAVAEPSRSSYLSEGAPFRDMKGYYWFADGHAKLLDWPSVGSESKTRFFKSVGC